MTPNTQTIKIDNAVKAINVVIDKFKETSDNSRLNTILDLVRSQQLSKLFQLKDTEKPCE